MLQKCKCKKKNNFSSDKFERQTPWIDQTKLGAIKLDKMVFDLIRDLKSRMDPCQQLKSS